MITNQEIFEAFFDYCQSHSIEETIKEYGGGSIYIPSYKQTYRDTDLYARYKAGASMGTLKREFHLSESQVSRIIRRMEREGVGVTPSLFGREFSSDLG